MSEPNEYEKWIRQVVRNNIEQFAHFAVEDGEVPDGVTKPEVWVAHVICSEANKHRAAGLDREEAENWAHDR